MSVICKNCVRNRTENFCNCKYRTFFLIDHQLNAKKLIICYKITTLANLNKIKTEWGCVGILDDLIWLLKYLIKYAL